MSKQTTLASGQITPSPHDTITVELVQSVDESARTRIIWPDHTTITSPRKYAEVAATAMRILANASTELARIKAGTRRSV
jgi:hypothetical protein